MDNTAFAGVVVGHSVPLICQLFAASVGGDNDNLKITNYDHLKFTKNGKF